MLGERGRAGGGDSRGPELTAVARLVLHATVFATGAKVIMFASLCVFCVCMYQRTR